MKKFQILIIALLISLLFCAFTRIQVVTAALGVSVAPAGPLTMIVGQTQVFTATVSGGTGAISYQWYLDGGVVSGQTASNLHLYGWGVRVLRIVFMLGLLTALLLRFL